MARKKRKSATRRGISPPGARAAWDIFRAAADSPVPLWRWFWPLLAGGFALRVAAALGGDFSLRHDEDFQVLEQAHRLVWGYGLVPWEFGVGARSWLTVLPAALPLAICKFLGLESPDQYTEAVEIFHAALSMSVPVGLFVFARNHYGEAAGRVSLVLGCFWHELALFAPHALSEFYGAYFIFAALALMSRRPSRMRAAAVGALLGFGIVFRFPYGLAAAAAAAAWIFALSERKDGSAAQAVRAGIIGGAVPALAFLAADWAAWGRPGHSLLMYAAGSRGGMSRMLENHDRLTHLVNLASSSGGVQVAALALALAGWRRHGLVLALFLPTLAFHSLQSVQFYTHIAALAALLLAAAGDGIAKALAAPGRRLAGIAACAWCLLVFAAGLAGQVPQHYKVGDGPWEARVFALLGEDPNYAARRFVSRLPAGEVGGVAIEGWDRGGYYRLHHKVPLYDLAHPGHAALFQNRDWRTAATHFITERNMGGMEPLYESGGVKVYRTGARPSPPPPGYGTDVYSSAIVHMLLRTGALDSPPGKIPFP